MFYKGKKKAEALDKAGSINLVRVVDARKASLVRTYFLNTIKCGGINAFTNTIEHMPETTL